MWSQNNLFLSKPFLVLNLFWCLVMNEKFFRALYAVLCSSKMKNDHKRLCKMETDISYKKYYQIEYKIVFSVKIYFFFVISLRRY